MSVEKKLKQIPLLAVALILALQDLEYYVRTLRRRT